MEYLKNISTPIALLSLAFSSFLVGCVWNYEQLIIDDAYITFQYAKNFAFYGKPFYNLSSNFQGNGQTSLLWMWILSLFNALGIKSEIIFIIINIILSFYLVTKLGTLLNLNRSTVFQNILKIIFLGLFTYWLALCGTLGLETVLAAIILLRFLEKYDSSKNIYAVLLPLVRPEFFLLSVFWVVDHFINKENYRKPIFYSFLGLCIFAGFYVHFYDFYIPLPFLYKTTAITLNWISIKVIVGYFILFSPVIFHLVSEKKLWILLGFIGLIVYYTFFITSYSSGIYIRYLFPLMMYFFIIDYKKRASLFFIIIGVISVVRFVDLCTNFYSQKKEVVTDNNSFYEGYGKLISKIKPGEKVLIMDAGLTAYFSAGICYDGLGLNDATLLLARKNNDGTAYSSYIKDQSIETISIGSRSKELLKPRLESEKFIANSLQLHSKTPQYIYKMGNRDYLFVYQYKKP